jgi:dolichol-phosphate mannosyltransferase
MDGDLQDPPELIPELYEQWKRGNEVVYAQRVSRDGESYFKKASAFFFYRILKWMTRVPIPLDTGDFRLIDRKVVEALRLMPERRKFLRGQIAWTGYRSVAVPYRRDPRFQGKTNYSFGKMFRLAWDGISGFSTVPLKLVSIFGLAVALVAFALILYALWSHFVWGETVKGWTSLISVVLFLGGVQLLSTGIIGEYISRMDENIRQRPLYLLKESRLGDNHDSGSTTASSPDA